MCTRVSTRRSSRRGVQVSSSAAPRTLRRERGRWLLWLEVACARASPCRRCKLSLRRSPFNVFHHLGAPRADSWRFRFQVRVRPRAQLSTRPLTGDRTSERLLTSEAEQPVSARLLTHTDSSSPGLSCLPTHTHAHTHARTHTHERTKTHTYARTHTHIHTRTHTYTRTHTHMYSFLFMYLIKVK